MLQKILIGVVASLMLILTIVGYLYKGTLQENAQMEDQILDYQFRIAEQNEKILDYSSDLVTIRKTNSKVGQEYLNVINQLNSYKNREDVLKEKPVLVGEKIKTNFNEYMMKVRCSTGDKEACKQLKGNRDGKEKE